MINQNDKNWERYTLWAIIGAAIFRLVIFLRFGLTPQESYYWNFARHPSLGYFDHPSVTPWTIWLTTKIFGTNIFGIRLGAWLYGIGALIFLWLIAKKLWDEKIAFWTVVSAICIPLFDVAGMFFTPDPPLVFFWLGATFFIIRATENDLWKDWILTGLFAGLAMLSKYTAAFWFLGAFIFLLINEKHRKYFLSQKLYIAAVISLAAFSPEIIWNAQHRWASFLYQSTRRANEIRHLRFGYFFGYIGAQLFAVSPILYIGAVIKILRSPFDYIKSIGQKIEGTKNYLAELVILSFSLPMLLFFSAVAIIYWVKLNWLIPIYFVPMAGIVGWSIEHNKKWHFYGIILAALTTLIIIAVMVFPLAPITGELASTFGWKKLANRVENELSQLGDGTFIFGAEYKVPAELSYHLPNHPQVCGPNVIGLRGMQFTYWVNIDTLTGKNAIFAIDPRWGFSLERAKKLLPKYFAKIEETEPLPIYRAGAKVTTYYIFRCYGYEPRTLVLDKSK
ncbi:glycosyltransferase family 39 protein [bacterium]|nr:glycosyltransferase family 39 protein [bacterium]